MHVRRRHSYNASCRSEYLGIRCGSLSSAQHNCALGSWATCGNPACAPILGCDGCNRVHHCSGEYQTAHVLFRSLELVPPCAECYFTDKQHKGACRNLKALGDAVSLPTAISIDELPCMSSQSLYCSCAHVHIEEKNTRLLVKRILRNGFIFRIYNESKCVHEVGGLGRAEALRNLKGMRKSTTTAWTQDHNGQTIHDIWKVLSSELKHHRKQLQ